MPVKKERKKYMLVEIAWKQKDIKAAAGAVNLSVAKFSQVQIQNAVNKHNLKQKTLV
jgi:hypothetical protein